MEGKRCEATLCEVGRSFTIAFLEKRLSKLISLISALLLLALVLDISAVKKFLSGRKTDKKKTSRERKETIKSLISLMGYEASDNSLKRRIAQAAIGEIHQSEEIIYHFSKVHKCTSPATN